MADYFGDGVFRLDGWIVHPDDCLVTKEGEEQSHKLTPRAMSVLVYLSEHPEELVTTDQLLEEFWPGTYVAPNAVQKIVSEIRKVLEEDPRSPRILKTIHKRGYKLLLKPHAVPQPPNQRTTGRLFATHRRALSVATLATLTISFLFLAHLPSNETDEMKRLVNEHGHSVGLILRSSGADAQLASRVKVVLTRELLSLGYTETTMLTVDPEMILAGVLETYELDKLVRLSIANDTVTMEALPFVNGTQYTSAVTGENAIESVTSVLVTILEQNDLNRMMSWGTLNPEAYQLAKKAAVLESRANLDSLVQASPLLEEAISLDPRFELGYLEFGGVLADIAKLSPDQHASEKARSHLLTLIDKAETHSLATVAVSLRRKVQYLDAANPMTVERELNKRLRANPEDFEAIYEYSGLLIGAGLASEALAYAEAGVEGLPAAEREAAWISRQTDVWDGLDRIRAHELALRHLKEAPNDLVSLHGMVERLSHMGRFAEAERYLERLKLSDKGGAWTLLAGATLSAVRGDFEEDQAAFAAVINHPKMTSIGRGRLYFTIGDVESGISEWKNLEPSFRWILWRYSGASDTQNFAPEVVGDPRYQMFLDDLGVGSRWRAYLYARTKSLESITGIKVTGEAPISDISLVASNFDDTTVHAGGG